MGSCDQALSVVYMVCLAKSMYGVNVHRCSAIHMVFHVQLASARLILYLSSTDRKIVMIYGHIMAHEFPSKAFILQEQYHMHS